MESLPEYDSAVDGELARIVLFADLCELILDGGLVKHGLAPPLRECDARQLILDVRTLVLRATERESP